MGKQLYKWIHSLQIKRVSLGWRSIVKLLDMFKGMAQAEAGTSETILFWRDMWNGRVLHIIYPHLHSCAINQEIKLSAVLNEESIQNLFHLPLSDEAFTKFTELELFLQTLNTTNISDT
jgi:hypothetical protein